MALVGDSNPQVGLAAGGAGGGRSEIEIDVTVGDTFTVTVPAGGAGVRLTPATNVFTATSSGNAGGTASFGAAASATGGAAPTATVAVTTGAASVAMSIAAAAGGTGTGGSLNLAGGPGGQISNIYTPHPTHRIAMATGGGSAPSVWGPGYSGGNIILTGTTTSNLQASAVTGGGGVSGPGGHVNMAWTNAPMNASGSGNRIATGGGSSVEAGKSLQIGTTTPVLTLGGCDSKFVTATTGVASTVQPETLAFLRWRGDVLTGGAGPGEQVVLVDSTTAMATNAGGYGAGSGGATAPSSVWAAGIRGANAGFLAGSGGVSRDGTASGAFSSEAYGGVPGIGAGSGGVVVCGSGSGLTPTNFILESAAGGNGFVLVEW
jgi:hypothetical protein